MFSYVQSMFKAKLLQPLSYILNIYQNDSNQTC